MRRMKRYPRPRIGFVTEYGWASLPMDDLFLLPLNFNERDESTTSEPENVRCTFLHVKPPWKNHKRKGKTALRRKTLVSANSIIKEMVNNTEKLAPSPPEVRQIANSSSGARETHSLASPSGFHLGRN